MQNTTAKRTCKFPVLYIFSALVLLLGTALLPPLSAAQSNAPQEKRSRLQKITEQIKEKWSFFRKLEKDEGRLVAELKKIDNDLQNQGDRLDDYRERLRKHSNELKSLTVTIAELETRYRQKQSGLAKRLRAIYKMGDLGYLTPLFSMLSYSNIQQELKYLQRISEGDRQLIADTQKDMHELLQQKKTLQKQKKKIAQLEQDLQKQLVDIRARQVEKTRLLRKIVQDKEQHASLIRELEKSAGKLDSYLKKLERDQQRTLLPASTSAGKAVVNPNASKISYAEHFRSNKGKLLWPVEGRIMTNYGPLRIDNTSTHYNGVDIQADRGTPFYAVFKGRVKYADWFQDYGRLIILDHGGGFYSLYAHAEELNVKAGELIETRQQLGRVGDSDSTKGAHLYFEVRVQGKPDNPQKWLVRLK